MYIPVKIKLLISILFAVMWLSVSLYLAFPWVEDLEQIFGLFLSWFIVTGIALVPGFAMAFMNASLLFDKRPEYDIPELPPISILIAAYNEQDNIAATLGSVCNQEYPGDVEIIVIDDGSDDDTVQEVIGYIGGYQGPFAIKLERLPENSGKAMALNFGLSQAVYDVLVTIDSDTTLYKNALKNLAANLVLGPPNTAAVAGTILVHNSRKSIVTKMQEWDYFLGIAVIKRTQSLFQGTLVAQGAFSAYYKAAVKELNGWTSTVGEDIVLTWGLRENGYRVGYAENAFAFTNVPETYGAFFRQRRRWSRGLMEAFKKHPKVISEVRLNSFFIWLNMFFPYTDFVYLFVFVPGIIAALFFQFYAVVGVMTLMLLPLAIVINLIMFTKQKRIFAHYGLHVRKNIGGLLLYMFFYQLLMSPACLAGYLSEFMRSRKSW